LVESGGLGLRRLEEWAVKSTASSVVIFGLEGCGKTAFKTSRSCAEGARMQRLLPESEDAFSAEIAREGPS
jgi:hypothetical protein